MDTSKASDLHQMHCMDGRDLSRSEALRGHIAIV